MARRQNRLLSLLVALVMLLTLIPVFPAQAASSQYFTFPSFGKTPTEAQNNPVNVEVIDQFHGTFSQTVPQTLSYKVQQQVLDAGGNWGDKGTPKIVANTTPVISGPSNQEFSIQKVQLFIGMNKITISTPSGVEGVCYVFYDNAPVIYDIALNNGDKLNGSSTPYVDVADQFFIIKTSNADAVTVNGVNATKYGSGAFSVSNFHLVPGLNTLVFVAKSDTRQYSVTRQIIYLDGPGALYNVYMQSDINNTANDAVQIDGGKVITSASSLPLGLKGQISVPANAGVPDPQLAFDNLKLYRDGIQVYDLDTTSPQLTGKVTLNAPTDDGKGHKLYNFFLDLSGIAAGGSWPIKSNGTYTFTLTGKYYDGTAQRKPLVGQTAFVFKDSSKASIANVQQVFGVDETTNGGGTPGYFSSSISNLPIYALVTAQNNAGDFTPQISVSQNGTTVNLVDGTDFTVVASDTTPGQGFKKIKIIKLPFVNDMVFNYSIVDAGNTDNFTPISVKYTPIPSIVLYNIYDGDNYTLTDLPDFTGKLFNFVSNTEKQNIKVTVNGQVKHATIDLTTNRFSVVNADPTAPNQLKGVLNEGANEVIVEGTAQGIPVITRLTVYYFTTDAPGIEDPFPVPVPTGAAPSRSIDDPTHKFAVDPSSKSTYNTTEKTADILFSVTNADKAVIMKDGVQFFTITFNADGTTTPALPFTAGTTKIDIESALPGYVRIIGLPLAIGTNSYVFKGLKGPITTFKPLSIVRSNPPYQVLSPLLPQERVVNQNFVPVIIKADGADKVLIGKTEMNKVTENGEIYFTSEVSSLKPGINTIKYTVVRGTQQANDQFDVNYANTDTVGAQYRASLTSSTSMKVFNNKISLSFPKGTMLTPYNDTTTKIELFDKQQFLFGIADPLDGRTQKTYNHNGSVVQINSDDGNFMRTMLNVPVHFGYASQLFWVDAGYYDTTQPGYVQLNGMQPYYGIEKNYNDPAKPFSKYNVWSRTMGTSWLKPTNRGTITLKYDEAVRDFAANRLSIQRFTMENGQMNWVNVGGKVDSKSHTISASVDSFGYYAVFLNTYGFDDTESHDFARDDMELMFARGIMNSKDGSEFGAYEPTTRGEFAQMMVKALDLPLNYDPNNYLFLDVPHSVNVSPYWDWRYIETAGQKGIVRGVGTRQYAPDDKVTREQAATMIALAMNLKLGKDYELSKKNLDKIYTDSGQISYYARTAIEAVYQQKLMIGRTIANSDPKGKPLLVFEPQANITRAESAKVVANMMRKFNKL